jgi:hypothetical protein
MTQLDPIVLDALDSAVPRGNATLADWDDVLRRSGSRARKRLPKLLTAALATAATVALLATPLGGAIARSLGNFSDWVTGAPGKPAPAADQRWLDQANAGSVAPFAAKAQLRELIERRIGSATYTLFGFRSANAVCLRLVVSGVEGSGPQLSCLARSDLQRSHDLAIPLRANLSFGHVGPLPRTAGDPPTVPRALASFGFVAGGVRRVVLESDQGSSQAAVANGAFLHVLDRPRRGTWVRGGSAFDARGRPHQIAIVVSVSGERSRLPRLRPQGPARVTREVRGGTIRWFQSRGPRGADGTEVAALFRHPRPRLPRWVPMIQPGSFARLIQADTRDFLREFVAAGDRPGTICAGLVTRGGSGAGCRPLRKLFSNGPLAIGWGFSGAGQQFWTVDGLASDDVARVEIFLGTGEHFPAPLHDNVLIVRLPAAKFPARVVAYDSHDEVIAIHTIGPG